MTVLWYCRRSRPPDVIRLWKLSQIIHRWIPQDAGAAVTAAHI